MRAEYRAAFVDWMACAVRGASEPAARAVAAARLLRAPPEAASGLAALRAGGLRAAFGSDGKSIQVGLAAATGVAAARLPAAGPRIPVPRGSGAWSHAVGGG